MTNAEAIAILNRMQNTFEEMKAPEVWEPQIIEDALEALDMAIAALRNKQKSDDSLLKSDPDSVSEGDVIHRQAAIDCEYQVKIINDIEYVMLSEVQMKMRKLPSAQPFHNITMNDVLKYIDGMPEDVWQEFTACLECRGWELKRRTAKWCGSDFA